MENLYRRLRTTGFDPDFVREVFLPDWWEDSLASVEANRLLAETFIARHLGVSLETLRDPDAVLHLPSPPQVQFKRYRNKVDESVEPAVRIAARAAQLIADLARDQLPAFNQEECARQIRNAILRKSAFIDLSSLLEYCWEHGILVLHLGLFPKKAKGFDGLALYVEDRPVIILGSKRDSPPWLAFHLAHEIGHVMLGHVQSGGQPLADADLQCGRVGSDEQEQEADRFACEVLTGNPRPRMPNQEFNEVQLALHAQKQGPAAGIDPGVYTLIYASSNRRWAAAQNALEYLRMTEGAHGFIAQSLLQRVSIEEAPETTRRFLEGVLSLPS